MSVLIDPSFALIDGSLPSASRISPEVNALFLALAGTSALVVLGLVIVIGIFLVRYRAGSSAPRPPLQISMWKFEAAWISATTVVFLVFFFWGARVYLKMSRPPEGAAVIDVIGRQWMWDIRHPEGRRELDELHVPVNQPVLLRLSSEDVIHSFGVPALRLKQDAVPGKTVLSWFEATVPGRYPIYCDQFCGTKHAEMRAELVVQTPEEHAVWLADGLSGTDAASRGRGLFIRYGCSGCHAGSTVVRAPRLEGIAGNNVPLEGGTFVTADDRYLRDSILLPNQQVAAGYAPVMPSYEGLVPEGDLLDLIAYLKQLGTQPPPVRPNLQ